MNLVTKDGSSTTRSIIFIGPYRVGKTTIAKMLSKEIGLPYYSLDEEFWDLLNGMEGVEQAKIDELSTLSLIDPQREEFNAFAVTAFLGKYKNGIFDFGSIHSVYTNERHFFKVREAIRAHHFVVLVLPTESTDESLRYLIERSWKTRGTKEEALHKHCLSEISSYQLATITIYTNGRTPEQTCEELLVKLHKRNFISC